VHSNKSEAEIKKLKAGIFTEGSYNYFMERYGVLVSEFRVERIGVKGAIALVLLNILRRLALATSLVF
jgi:hypothetical protein